MKNEERAVLHPFVIDWRPKAGDREIRVRPLPALGQTKPMKEQEEEITHV